MNWVEFDENDMETWPDENMVVLVWGLFYDCKEPVFRTSCLSTDFEGNPFFNCGDEGCFWRVKAWCVPQPPAVSRKFVKMPRTLTAENGAKAALIGEFSFCRDAVDEDGNEIAERIDVPWTTIKTIYSAAVDHFTKDMR